MFLLNSSVQTRRIKCRVCGIKTESLSWLEPYARITKRLKSYIEQLACSLLPIKHISQLTSVHWHTIKEIDNPTSTSGVPSVKWEAKATVMDEFVIFKGHRYATVIADAKTHQVIWIGLGRSQKDIRPFFELRGASMAIISAVAMDMNTAFDLEVQAHCPNAKIVYDLFHVVAKFTRSWIESESTKPTNSSKIKKRGNGSSVHAGCCWK